MMAVLKYEGRLADSQQNLYSGESYNGSITVSKTVHGGSNPSSPAVNPG